jgi:hypothetical protein
MVRARISERVVTQMAGHKTRAIVHRYHIVSEGDLRDAARKLDAAIPAPTATNLATSTASGADGLTVTPRNS